MIFKIGDYVTHKEWPKCNVVLHITDQNEKSIINAQDYNFKHATEEQIEDYHEGDFDETEMDD